MSPKSLVILGPVLLVAACAAPYNPDPELPVGQAAYDLMDKSAEQLEGAPYQIGPDDVLDVNVFFEPELSVKGQKVDRSGQIALPAVGTIDVEGLTTQQLAKRIEARMRGSLLRDPQVSVSVADSAKQRVVVAGQVQNPGVYEIRKDTTLLEAVARAGGETELAKLKEVAVIRTINGHRMAARFDVAAVMGGSQPDPKVVSNDVIVVGYSSSRALWRDIRQTVPLIGLFRPFYN